jgi:hemerythrin superfamily protein
MATRTEKRTDTKSSRDKSNRSNQSNGQHSAFSWGDAGGMLGAAAAGAAVAVAINLGRKAVTQGMSATAGDWDQVLATEHDAALAIFDRMLATNDSQTMKRSMLLMKLSHALDKHAYEEEHVVYPALREANEAHDADTLENEHGYIKTFLYELNKMSKDSPEFTRKTREFRMLVEKHARMEEEQIFPAFKRGMTEQQNKALTGLVNKAGFMSA